MTELRGVIGAAIVGALLAGAAIAGERPADTVIDQPARIGATEIVCTGFGRATRDDPKWLSYGTRIEFSNVRNEYLAGAVVSVRDAAGHPVVTAACEGPWLLMRLRPGDYQVEARLTDVQAKPRSARFHAPAKGQVRVVLQFPDAS